MRESQVWLLLAHRRAEAVAAKQDRPPDWTYVCFLARARRQRSSRTDMSHETRHARIRSVAPNMIFERFFFTHAELLSHTARSNSSRLLLPPHECSQETAA